MKNERSASIERSTSSQVWPSVGAVPWLHTFTLAVKLCPLCTLAGPLTSLTTRSARWPTPIGSLTRTLLSSRSSCSIQVVSTAAAR
ncbi:hypothetical protein DAT35_53820 [Vitiosangium sp. GDMCC 1.1324]|nr:hypothetical protein DAT35_53820 [Vitiosangium sp. GDMCC 1.1324]